MDARSTLALTLALFATTIANAQTAQPQPPQVTMGADIKLLRFDWQPVPGAAFYQLKFRPSGNSAYQLVGERIPASVTHTEQAIPVHLQDWTGMRFIVAACNSAGCTNSAALNPRSLMLETIGYLKASNTDPGDYFGQSVVLSDDGYTLAVSAGLESSDASGVNGDQTNNLSIYSGAVYVFRRRGNSWHQEAYLKAGENVPQQLFGIELLNFWRGVALSADGSTLAASATFQPVNGLEVAGAVYLFQRVRNVWNLVATFYAPIAMEHDMFGASPDLSDDGRTLKVNSARPVNEFGQEVRTHIFVRPGNTWRRSVILPPASPGDTCISTRLSGDGQTLVMTCGNQDNERRIVTMKRSGDTWVHASDLPTDFGHLRQSIALNSDATVMALDESDIPSVVGLYRWVGGNWVREAGFPAPTVNEPNGTSGWGWDLQLGGGGNLLGIGAPQALDEGAGISHITTPGTAPRGAVYLYQRNPSTNSWALRNVVKSANPGFRDSFGASLSLSASGRTLAVGAWAENSNATGIDGVRANEDAPNAGATYLY